MKNTTQITVLTALTLAASCQGLGAANSGGVEVGDLTHACRSFALNNNGEFPAKLRMLVERDSTGAAYLQEASAPVCDVWGRPYGYEVAKGGAECRVTSLGRDRAVGGEGDDKDVNLTLVLPGR